MGNEKRLYVYKLVFVAEKGERRGFSFCDVSDGEWSYARIEVSVAAFDAEDATRKARTFWPFLTVMNFSCESVSTKT